MPLHQRFETLLLFDPNRSPTTANVWISRPSPSEEQALGKLIVITDLPGTDRVNLDVISLIQEELRTGYYQSTDTKPERAFEQALQQTNRRLHSVITDGVSSWVEKANIIVAAAWRDQVIISTVGSVHSFMLRHGRIHDILDPTPQTVNPVRIFSHVMSGQLQADDQLLLCTPSLLDYFSLEQLRRALLDGSPSAVVRQWETTLLGVEQQSSFAAVILQALPEEALVTPVSRPTVQATLRQSAPQASMEHLIAKEQATERLLSPSVWPAVQDIFSQTSHSIRTTFRRLILRKPVRHSAVAALSHHSLARSNGPSRWSTISRSIAISLTRLWHGVRTLFPKRSNVPTTPEPVTMAPAMHQRRKFSLNSLVRWFQNLSARQQLLAGISVILIFVFAISVAPKSHKQTATTVTTASSSVTDHLSKATAALLYGGEETAQQEVTAAQTALNTLPNRSSKDKAARQVLQTKVNQVILQLAHQTIIPNPTAVSQLAPVSPQVQPSQLYLVGTKLIAADPDHSTVISVDLQKNGVATLVTNPLDTGKPTTGTVNGTKAVTFATDRRGFVELDITKNTWKPIDSAWPTPNGSMQSLTTYQNRLYVLDTSNSDIVRFTRATNSLGKGASWLKEKATLGSARSVAVDGSVYVLQPKGVIEVYANGRKGSFTVPATTPALTDPTRLWTDLNTKNLYLVDPSNHRIVVFSKTGKLVDQYTSDSWKNLHDVAVNEKTKTAYVVNGSTIYSFTLIH